MKLKFDVQTQWKDVRPSESNIIQLPLVYRLVKRSHWALFEPRECECFGFYPPSQYKFWLYSTLRVHSRFTRPNETYTKKNLKYDEV